MTADEQSYKDKKVISIGIVSELTGLSVRQIRYYEERKLIYPQRSSRGTRKYSFADVERLMDIANKREDGVQTAEILKDMRKKNRLSKTTRSSAKKCWKDSLMLILSIKTADQKSPPPVRRTFFIKHEEMQLQCRNKLIRTKYRSAS